jgi:hypothetical protein
MKLHVQVPINKSKEEIWKVIADIENSMNIIDSIEEIVILEKPDNGLIGLKWSEKRIMYGKEATETMWITDAVPNEYYVTEAESHGSKYVTRVFIPGDGNVNYLAMDFVARPLSTGAKITWGLLGFLFKGATKKALQKDLDDIKKVVEGGS